MSGVDADDSRTLLHLYAEREWLQTLLRDWPVGEARRSYEDCVLHLVALGKRIDAMEAHPRRDTSRGE